MINQTAQPPAWLKVLYFVQILYPAIYEIPKFIAIIRQLRTRIPQTAIGGKPQRSRNQEINANASDLRAFVVLRFRVGLYVPGAFAANTRIPAQAAGIESRGMLTPAACRPHGVHFLPEGERGARHLQEPGSVRTPCRPQPSGRPQQETPAMPSDFHVFGVFALRGTVTRPDAFRPSARICEHLAGIACCPLSFRNLRTPRRCRHGSAADCPEGERRPRLPSPWD